MPYERSVFINCPFDDEYAPLLKPLLHTLIAIGFEPRIAMERNNAAEVRLDKIKELIEGSMYSIHDLSRVKSKDSGEYYRFNMPFELGLDLGCRLYHVEAKHRQKRFLILEAERYSTQKALSDLSFTDCKCHQDESEELIHKLRSWLVENGVDIASSPSTLWDDFNVFMTEMSNFKMNQGFQQKDINRLPIAEFIAFAKQYYRYGSVSELVSRPHQGNYDQDAPRETLL